MKMVNIGELLTDKELAKAREIYRTTKLGERHKALVAQVVEPAMKHINEVTGQENDAGYIAYALEYAIASTGG